MQLHILLTPKASKNQIEGWATNAKGVEVLKAKVTPVPENGKANTAMIKLLSKVLKVAKSKVKIERGNTSRHKVLEVEGVEK